MMKAKHVVSWASVLTVLCTGTAVAAAKKIQVPEYKRWVMKNGLTLVVAEHHELPLVSMRVMVRAGSMTDPQGKEGLANLTATLLRRGAGDYDADSFVAAVDQVGGVLNTGAELQTSFVSAEFMTKDFDYGMGLLAELLIRPRFEAEEVGRELRQAIAERRQAMDDPSTLVSDQMMINLFKDHPYGHPTEGLVTSLETITREDITGFYMRYWAAANCVLAVVGDVDPGKVKSLVERTMMEWQSGARNNEVPSLPDPVQGRRIVLVSKPDATQTQIRLCQVGIDRRNEDYFPVMVANTVLGSGFTSWLVEEIRVNRGLSYSASSRFEPYAVGGLFRISTFTKNITTKETIEVALAQVYRLHSGDLDSATLTKAKNYIIGQYTMRLETAEAMAGALLDLEYYGQPKSWIEDYAQNIEAVTIEDVRRVAQEKFPYDDLLFVIVSDPGSVQEQLEPFGSVEVITPTQ